MGVSASRKKDDASRIILASFPTKPFLYTFSILLKASLTLDISKFSIYLISMLRFLLFSNVVIYNYSSCFQFTTGSRALRRNRLADTSEKMEFGKQKYLCVMFLQISKDQTGSPQCLS